jgi:cyclic pyranopterin phosphate synthase
VTGLLDVILLYDCNLACGYCTIMGDVGTPGGFAERLRPRSLPPARVAAAMREARAAGYDAIAFTGGEPTLRADLLPLVREARRLGFESVKVQSNGLLFASEANVARAIDAGVTRFHVSIHAHRETRYDAIVRTPGRWPAMVAALEALVGREVDPTADVIVMRDTLSEIPATVAWLADRGVRQVDLWLVSLTDGNRGNVASLPPLAEVAPVAREAFAVARARGLRARSLHLPRCLLGDDHVHAFDPGRGRVRVLSPDDDFELHASKLTPTRHVPACEGCVHRPVCPGLRPDYLEVFGDREIAAARGVAPTLAPRRQLATIA